MSELNDSLNLSDDLSEELDVGYKNIQWNELINNIIQQELLASSVKRRLNALENLNKKLETQDFQDNLTPALLNIIILTVPRYLDNKSRKEIINLIINLFKNNNKRKKDEPCNNVVLKAMSILIEKEIKSVKNCSSKQKYVILNWTYYLIDIALKSNADLKSNSTIISLMKSQSLLLESILLDENAQDSLKRQSIKVARKAIIKNKKIGVEIYSNIALANEGKNWGLLLGLSIDVAIRKEWKDIIEKQKIEILQFYLKNIFSSKNENSEYYLNSFKSFNETYVTFELFKEHLYPTINKLLLRSPEVVLSVLNSFVNSVKFSVLPIFSEKSFTDNIITNVYSTNLKIKNDAQLLFKSIASNCSDSNDEEKISNIIKTFMKIPSGKSNPESKQFSFSLITYFNSLSKKFSIEIIEQLMSSALKESNDLIIKSINISISHLLKNFNDKNDQDIINSVVQYYINGLTKANKSAIRNAFLYGIKNGLTENLFELISNNEKGLTDFVKALLKILKKVQDAGIAMLNTSSVKDVPSCSEGYYCIEWIQNYSNWEEKSTTSILKNILEETKFYEELVNKSSFLLMDKLYSKVQLQEEEEMSFANVIINLLKMNNIEELVNDNENAFSDVVTYLSIKIKNHDVRKYVNDSIKEIMIKKFENDDLDLIDFIVKTVSVGIINSLNEIEANSLKSQTSINELAWPETNIYNSNDFEVKVYSTLKALLPNSSLITGVEKDIINDYLEDIVLRLVVILCHPIIVKKLGNDKWIQLCYSVELDPNEIVTYKSEDLISKWINKDNENSYFGTLELNDGSLFKATLNAISMFTSINDSTVLPLIASNSLQIIKDYKNTSNLTKTDIEIWKTPEGEVYDDPLKKNNNKSSQKLDDWEKKLQSEIEAKRRASGKANNVKLTREQKVLIEKQLSQEAEVRKNVQNIYQNTKVALHLIESVVNGIITTNSTYPEDDVIENEELDNWIGSIVDSLLNCIILFELNLDKHGEKYNLLYEYAIIVMEKLGKCLPKKINKLIEPPTLLYTILRSYGVGRDNSGEEISEKWTNISFESMLKKTLNEMISYPDNFVTASTFAYMFPLIDNILEVKGEINSIPEKNRLELIDKSVKFIVKYFKDEYALFNSISQVSLIKCLIGVVAKYPKFVNECFNGIVTLCEGVRLSQEQLYEEEEEEDEENENEKEKDKTKEMSVIIGQDNDTFVKELLNGLLSEETDVRKICLKGISIVDIPSGELETMCNVRINISTFDENPEISEFSKNIFIENNGEDYEVNYEEINEITELIIHPIEIVRINSAKALSTCLKNNPDIVNNIIEKIYNKYKEINAQPIPEYDEFGMVIKESMIKEDNWPARIGIAITLKYCAGSINTCESLEKLYKFLIYDEALGDSNEDVRREMLEAGLSAIKMNGKEYIKELLSIMNGYLSKPAQSLEVQDRIRESVVISMGTLSQHLDSSDPSIPVVVAKLIDTLKTPSEAVQEAVANCLPGLIKSIKEESVELIKTLLDNLLNGKTYGERRGSAYGLAGVIKGRGMSTLKECDVMQILKEAVSNKKKYEHREGALCAFETLSMTLGRLFEPYIIQIIPYLLVCFGDPKIEVREATQDASRVIMGKISGHCVKLILPSLLEALKDKNWRTKTGSIDFLGTMAFCAPKQLSVSLPTIIPNLCEVLSDSHMKVQEAAKDALGKFGQVIKNPEIQELVPVLIEAMVNPDEKTSVALKSLLETAFVHYIDAPSLALVMPIISRGLKERNTEIKKMASQIMGNMSSLTDKKDIVPYLEQLMPSLKEVLIDPNPEARAFAAKALGTMVEKLGEDNFPGLMPELVKTLKSDSNSVDRSGAAQGLSEVIYGLGISRLESILPEIIANTKSSKQYVREGFMTLLVYLPATFSDKFQPYLTKTIPSILRGLADESESVRDISMKAGQMIVQNYATVAVDLLLPELKKGLFDDNWRIRLSSIQLIGDLLYRIIGFTNKSLSEEGNENEELDNNESETARKVLIFTLGDEGYLQVLASIYIVRSDASAVVRQCSIHIWKSIVSNTPKTLKEILPILMNMIINNLASVQYEKRQGAARTLADLVRKLGDGVIEEILPTFSKSLDSPNSYTRQGVCIGMSNIMSSAGKTQLVDLIDRMVPLIQKSLVDPEAIVREASAQAFDVLHQNIGSKAIDEILPKLLNDLKEGDSSTYALEALKEIMAIRSHVVFPVLIPTLISRPITSFNASALGSLISVAGQSLNRRINIIIPALMEGLNQNDDALEDIRNTLEIALASIEDDEGVMTLVELLLNSIRDEHSAKCLSGCYCLEVFCKKSNADISLYTKDLINVLICLFNNKNADIVKASCNAFASLTSRINKDSLDKYVKIIRKSIAEVCEELGPNELLSGLCEKTGISTVLIYYLHSIMYSSFEIREQAASGIGEVVQYAAVSSLEGFVTKITGPLIRVIGDRFPPQVKAAILKTLNELLIKVPRMLKPFLPQLQRTFIKSLTENAADVRNQAAKALSVLVPLQPRLDPLFIEINNGYKNATDNGVKEAMISALYHALKTISNQKITDTTCSTIEKTIIYTLYEESESTIRNYSAQCFGVYCKIIAKEKAKVLIEKAIEKFNNSDSSTERSSAIISILNVYIEIPDLINELELSDEIIEILINCFDNIDILPICDNAVRIAGQLLKNDNNDINKLLERFVPSFVNLLNKRPSECKRTALIVIKYVAKNNLQAIVPYLKQLVPVIMICVRDRNIPVKLSGERALVYLFNLKENDEILQKYLKTLEGPSVRTTSDYARRVLTKLASQEVESEDENVFDTIG